MEAERFFREIKVTSPQSSCFSIKNSDRWESDPVPIRKRSSDKTGKLEKSINLMFNVHKFLTNFTPLLLVNYVTVLLFFSFFFANVFFF